MRTADTVVRLWGRRRRLQCGPGPLPAIAPPRAGSVVTVALLWHSHAISRTRLSTTVDSDLLREARETGAGSNDAELIDAALSALLQRFRRAELDEAYEAAYTRHPIGEPDEWGDLGSFRDAAGAT